MPRLDPTVGLIGVLLTAVAVMGTVYFWIMGAVLLATNNGGQITRLSLDGVAGFLFYAYPVVAVLALLLAVGLLLLDRPTEAVGIAGLPIVGLVVYYLVSTMVLI